MYPFADEAPGDTLWELGLDFTVSPGKTGFRGAEEHYRLKGKERFKIFGLLLEGAAPAAPGDAVYDGKARVGVVTCPMVSTLTAKSMAIARLDVPSAVHGKALTVGERSKKATAHSLPFDDPQKLKRTAA